MHSSVNGSCPPRLKAFPNRLDVELIGAATRLARIDDRHRCAGLNKGKCEVATDKAQAAGD